MLWSAVLLQMHVLPMLQDIDLLELDLANSCHADLTDINLCKLYLALAGIHIRCYHDAEQLFTLP